MHQNERWQLFYNNGEPIAGKWRSAELNNPSLDEDDIVGGASVFLYRKNQEGGIELLWQQRSETMDNFPGKWDVSAGGHVNLGETFVDAAVREADEEIGAKIAVDDLAMVSFRRTKNIIVWIYAVDYTGRNEEFKFDDGEVKAVRWVPLSEMNEFRKNFAKEPLAKDNATYLALLKWFEKSQDEYL